MHMGAARGMNVASLHRIITADPSDTSGLLDAVEHGLDPSRVVAVVGKTEGNGCVNDFTRGMAAAAWQAALPVSVIAVMSGGTEGVLSPTRHRDRRGRRGRTSYRRRPGRRRRSGRAPSDRRCSGNGRTQKPSR